MATPIGRLEVDNGQLILRTENNLSNLYPLNISTNIKHRLHDELSDRINEIPNEQDGTGRLKPSLVRTINHLQD